MASLSDSNTQSVKLSLTFTEQAARCIPPSIQEALRQADLRLDLPESASSEVKISELTDNLIRQDSTGALYAPATQVVEVSPSTITIQTSTAPGVPTNLDFQVPSVTSLETAFLNLFYDIQPPGALVRDGKPTISGSVISVPFYRLNGSPGPPYEQVVVTGSGRILVVPAPSTA